MCRKVAVDVAPYLSWETAADDIQSAIDVASSGDTVLVADGVYAIWGVHLYR